MPLRSWLLRFQYIICKYTYRPFVLIAKKVLSLKVQLNSLFIWDKLCIFKSQGLGHCYYDVPHFADFEVNNMLITLGGVTNNCNRKEARDRISMTLRNSGIPITITTISYVTGFAVGTTSGYIAIKLTSIYTGRHVHDLATNLDAQK